MPSKYIWQIFYKLCCFASKHKEQLTFASIQTESLKTGKEDTGLLGDQRDGYRLKMPNFVMYL